MKKIIKTNFLFLCVVLMTTTIKAQTTECVRNFTIKTVSTPSTCMANGTVTVTLEGDLTDLEKTKTEYALRPVDGTSGTSLQFSKNNVLSNITAGNYVVSVRTFCLQGDEVGVVKEATNVKVEGNYKPLMVEFDLSRSRNSYKECATGLLAFNMKNGTGYGNKTYYLINAPAGVTRGEVFPTNEGTAGDGYIKYSIPGLYPPGDYQIEVHDDCSIATMSINLKEITGMPAYSISGSSFKRPNEFGNSHNKVRKTSITTPDQATQPDYYRYYRDNLYQVAIIPTGTLPTDADWHENAFSSIDLTLPGKYFDYFIKGSKTISVFLRIKGCDATMKEVTKNIKLNYPYYSYGESLYCNDYRITRSNYSDQDGFWHYPVNVKITNKTDNAVVFEKDYAVPQVSIVDTLLYGKEYEFMVTDQMGITTKDRGLSYSKIEYNFTPNLYTTNYKYNCNTTTFTIYPASQSYTTSYMCYPINVVVKKKNPSNGLYEDYTTYQINTYYHSVEWEYGEYEVTTTFPNHTKEDGTPYTYSANLNLNSNRPERVIVSANSYSSYNYSAENLGYLALTGRNITNTMNTNFMSGTTFTIVDAPDGYIHKGKTLTIPESSSNATFYILGSSVPNTSYYTTHAYMPDGDYTIRIQDPCGLDVTVPINDVKVGYNVKDIRYSIEENGCGAAHLKVEGLVKFNGNPNTAGTNFKIISGPSGGYETSLKKYNETLSISTDGEYIIGTVVNTSYSNTYIRRDTIQFEKSKPILNPTITASYVCTESTIGTIIVEGQGGYPPYSYELLNQDGSSTGQSASNKGEGERVVFYHGAPGEVYSIRITDGCGNSTTQAVELADLEQQNIVFRIPGDGLYCVDDTIKLNCITLGQTNYYWEEKLADGTYAPLPDGNSTKQNPRFIATEAMAGTHTYRITVTPEFCGQPVSDELNITVYPKLKITETSEDQEICVATLGEKMSSTSIDGKGNHTFQWQVSTDKTVWNNVTVGGTYVTYAPTHNKSGNYYYRVLISDDCHTVTGDVITINVKPCYIMVNPNLKSKVAIK